MQEPWLAILENLKLSSTELEVVKRFKADPDGRSFLAIADILRSYHYIDESLELLTQGVIRHRSFTVARVVLVRELLHKGMVSEAWNTLEDSTTPLQENILAQKLKFKIALLLGYDSVVSTTLGHLRRQQMLDEESETLAEVYELSGLKNARTRLIGNLEALGVSLNLPKVDFADSGRPGTDGKGQGALGEEPSSAPLTYLESIQGFRVLNLSEVFHGEADTPSSKSLGGRVELDSMTLAEIYEKQGYYEKALAMYRRLASLSPASDVLRDKLSDLAKKCQEQRDTPMDTDPAIADTMEEVEIIDREIRFYQEMLEKLT